MEDTAYTEQELIELGELWARELLMEKPDISSEQWMRELMGMVRTYTTGLEMRCLQTGALRIKLKKDAGERKMNPLVVIIKLLNNWNPALSESKAQLEGGSWPVHVEMLSPSQNEVLIRESCPLPPMFSAQNGERLGSVTFLSERHPLPPVHTPFNLISEGEMVAIQMDFLFKHPEIEND
jgi:hypothetical protein